MSVKIKGFDKVIKEIDKSKIRAKDLSGQRMLLLAKLKEATPVLTGNARDGWQIEGNSLTNSVEYIEELNSGTSKQAPSFFIEKVLLATPGVYANGQVVSYR